MLVLARETTGMLIARGVLAVLFGLLALIWPIATVFGLAVLFAVYALIDGIGLLVAAFRKQVTPATGLAGAVGVVLAVVTVAWPGITVLALAIMAGAWAVVTGFGEIVTAIRLRKQIQGEVWLGLAGGLSVIAGLVILLQPIAGVIGIAAVLGVFALLYGIALLLLGYRVHKLTKTVDSGV
ncbi:HdeD family acid-resistance protein [Amycolatopsis sp. NPDC059657]|uniref:HdeD family acid-resistance protein n=1 Tax=Amycolatopsis sp. NPDC059657 TaxID=3346899 RepID=UPI00366C3AD1